MLNAGSTALPYQPYFIGLKSASFGGIKSTGKNLFDIDNPTIVARHINEFTQNAIKIENGIIYNGGVYGSSRGTEICIPVKKNTNYTFSFNATIDETNNPNCYTQASGLSGFNENNIHNGITPLSNAILVKNGANTLTVNSKDWNYISIAFWTNNKYAMAITDLQIEQNSEATEYEPYIEDTLIFPETEVGLGTTIDFENKKIIDTCYTDVIGGPVNTYNVNALGGDWAREGFFGFYIPNVLSKPGVKEASTFVSNQGFEQGAWSWSGLSFEKGTERYFLGGLSNKIAYFIIKIDCVVESTLKL
jgi:hypothetical protein